MQMLLLLATPVTWEPGIVIWLSFNEGGWDYPYPQQDLLFHCRERERERERESDQAQSLIFEATKLEGGMSMENVLE